MKLAKYKEQAWNKATDYDYKDHVDTIQLQKVCPWCGGSMIYSQFMNDPNKPIGNEGCWTVAFFLPLDKGGSKKIDNIQAIHAKCELEKGGDYTIVFGEH